MKISRLELRLLRCMSPSYQKALCAEVGLPLEMVKEEVHEFYDGPFGDPDSFAGQSAYQVIPVAPIGQELIGCINKIDLEFSSLMRRDYSLGLWPHLRFSIFVSDGCAFRWRFESRSVSTPSIERLEQLRPGSVCLRDLLELGAEFEHECWGWMDCATVRYRGQLCRGDFRFELFNGWI